jgi:autotransporter-associated beta strand protein
MDGTSMSTRTTVRLTGLISGGLAGSTTRWVDSGISLNNRGVLILENASNTFTTTPEIFRGTLAFTSDGALGDPSNGISVNAANNSGAPFDPTQQGLRFDANNIVVGAGRTIQLVGTENIDVQGFTGTIAGSITGLGLTKLGTGTLVLNGAGSLTGGTTVSAGTLLINNSWSGTAVSVSSGATLGGSGSIAGSVSIASGGALSPGNSIGTLAISNILSLGTTTVTTMEINAGTLACDKVIGLTSVTFSGTLNVVNLGGTLAAGQSFPLFSAGTYNGNFLTTNLPALSTGLKWNWNATSGTLSVVAAVATNPTNITAQISGGNLNLSWPSDHTGWRLQSETNALSVGLRTNWVTVPGSTNVNTMSFPIDHANGSVFFRLVYP